MVNLFKSYETDEYTLHLEIQLFDGFLTYVTLKGLDVISTFLNTFSNEDGVMLNNLLHRKVEVYDENNKIVAIRHLSSNEWMRLKK